ncbi:MAG TPA: hypothetical protein VNZ45_06585, partial [Bacteroidia bacterium]|nr:hypothetical protein [Bacteroidia bacterium]
MATTSLKHRFFTLLIALPFLGFAQKDSLRKLPKICISANMGVSMALGAYGTVIPNPNSGLPNPNPPINGAGTGINYNIVAGIAGPHQTSEYQVMLMHTANPIDMSTYVYDCSLGSWMGNEFTKVKSHYNRFEFTSAMIGIASTSKN